MKQFCLWHCANTYFFVQAPEKAPQQEPEHDVKNTQKGKRIICSLLTICMQTQNWKKGRTLWTFFSPQIRVCWLKYVSIRSGTQEKSLLLRQINRMFAGKLNLTTYPGPLLKTGGKCLHCGILKIFWYVSNIVCMYFFLCQGFLKVAMRLGWCGHHLLSLSHLTPSRRPRRGRHPWSQTLLNQEPVEKWLTAWSLCWGELVTMNYCCMLCTRGMYFLNCCGVFTFHYTRTMLRYFFPPAFRIPKDDVNSMTAEELVAFPLVRWFTVSTLGVEDESNAKQKRFLYWMFFFYTFPLERVFPAVWVGSPVVVQFLPEQSWCQGQSCWREEQ